MKIYPFVLFAGIHTAIATVLVISSASQAQNLYWDTDIAGNTLGNFGGSWNGVLTHWNTDATGNATGPLTADTSSSNALVVSGAGVTGVINLTIAESAASLDFANTANLAAFQLADGASLTLTGALTDTGAGNADIRIVNTSEANAATKLVASSITMGVISVASASGGVGQFFTTGYDMTVFTQYSIGSGSGTGGNTTIRQTAGTVTVNNAADRGFVFLATDNFPSSSNYTSRYILDGGTMKANRIGIANNDGNNNATNRWARDTRLEFNNGTLQTFNGGTLLLQNNLTFNTYNGTGTKDMGYNTSKPLTVELSQTGTHTFNADGASGTIIVTPSAQLVDKSAEAGTVTKTGLGNLILTGGGPVAVNSYTGATIVSAGKVMTDFSIIGGQAATGGTDNLSNAYSAASQLVLNGGNFELNGRSSANATSATGVTLTAGSTQANVGSTAGLVVGQSITNAKLPAGTYIRRIINATTVELSAMSTSTANETDQTLNFGAGIFANTQTINSVDLQQAGNATTVTVTPGTGTSTTLLSFGNVSGTGGFTKAGTGTLKLTGSVSYTGPTAINAGTLEYASAGNQTITANVTGTSSGTFVKSGAGTLAITSATVAANTFNGAVVVNGGTLSNGAGARGLLSASSFTVNNGGILLVNGDGLGYGAFGNLTVNAGGMFRGGVQQLGHVTLNGGLMDGTGSYLSVNFALNQDVTVGGSSASIIQGNAGLALSVGTAGQTRTFNVADATGNADADLTLSTALRNAYVSGNLANLQKTGPGTMVLSGNSTYTGTTTVSDGTLLVSGSLGDTAVTVANGATLGGSGTVGTSTVLNTFTVNGTLAPGNSPGILTVDDNLDLNGALRAELNGTTAGTGHDQLVVNGAVEINGSTLNASFDTFTPVNGNLLFILRNDGTDAITGTFTNLTQNATVANYGGFNWKISYNADSTANTFSGTPNGNDIALMAVPIAGIPTATTDEGSLNRYLWRLRFNVPDNINPQADEDGDGDSNLDEARSLTDPFDPQSKFVIQDFANAGSNLEITWPSEKGLGYMLQSSSDLKIWKNEGTSMIGTGAEMLHSVTDPNLLASSSLFLRIAAIQDIDSDNDGLMDWQEEIIGSNPNAYASLRAPIRGGDAAHFEALMLGANPFGGRAGTADQGVPSEENASRFLSQASMGPTPESIQAIQALGYEAWINDQFTKSLDVSGKPNDRVQKYIDWIIANRSYGSVPYYNFDTRADMPCQNVTTSWLRNALWSDAQLRQRVTWALSQIFVVSGRADDFFGRGDMLANFYDTLSENAFGNYEDLLLKVAIHPAMGVYLSHIFNLKADPAINRYPDENFAREIMQLFSIGLNQLNLDGTPVIDSNGQEIQTYSTEDIKEMARVFTGLQLNGRPWGNLVGGTHPALSQPMVVNSLYHDTGSKTMPDGTILPANTDGMVTIENAVAWLSNHPNTAPFISRRLIQFLVTSNPTPGYIQRVSSVFVNDGSGTRGNLGAVVKAILLDSEARSLNYLTDPYFGRLKEPMLRLTNTARVLEAGKAAGPAIDLSSFQFWNYPGELNYGQYPLHAPSVFNFYDLRYQMPGEVTDKNLLSPEFQILDSVTATSVINRNIKNLWAGNYNDFHGSASAANGPMNDWSKLITKSGEVDTDSFCDHVLLLWGANHSVGYRTREEMKKAVNYQASPTNDKKAQNAAFFALTAPECAIQR